MEGDVKVIEKGPKWHGVYGEYQVDGQELKLENGVVGYSISAARGAGQESKSYWVQDGKFWKLGDSQFDEWTTTNRGEIGVAKINPSAKRAILDAIENWEKKNPRT